MRFINDDVTLKNGGRNAAKISEDELWEKIVSRARKIGDEYEVEDDNGHDGEGAYRFIRVLIYNDETIRKDLKYNIDAENVLTSCDAGPNDEYVGMNTLPNGLTFYGFIMGGDWEIPAFVIIYWDGKKLRAYIPSYGNAINLECKCAFGSEDDSLTEEQKEKLLQKYKKLGLVSEEDDEEDEEDDTYMPYVEWAELYCKKYNLTSSKVSCNYDAMIKDIESRIVVS